MILLALAFCAGTPARAESGSQPRAKLDLSLFRAASCEALASEFAATGDVNPAALTEMRRSDSTSPESGNHEIAALAASGPRGGRASQSGDENAALAELAAYRQAIVIVAAEKKCALPGSGPGPGAAAH
ncbi:MAG TPA: hypothetical protein VH105_12975 [Burkholderiales bacterium]|nr:hypothetical protein [Burkholderiales bacterium]